MTNTERELALALGAVNYGKRFRLQSVANHINALARVTPNAELPQRQERGLWYIAYTFRRQLKKIVDAALYEKIVKPRVFETK
jgi:hypothetical protein